MALDLFVSVVIPVKKINYYFLNESLPSFDKLDYKKFEVIVVTEKNDIGQKNLLKKYSWLRVINSIDKKKPAEKRNFGVKMAKGEIVAFIDDDAYPDKNWLKKAVSRLSQSKISAVCGPGILPAKTNIWEKIFDEVLRSWIGSGGYAYRFVRQKKRFVDDYPSMNLLIKKNIYHKLGGFNNNYWPGEDSKLCEDLVYKNNGKILYDPEILVFHHRRNNLLDFIKQHGRYGFHRGAFFSHGDKNSRRLSYLVPSLFVIYLLFLLPFFYLPALVYLILLTYLFISSLLNTKNLFIAFLTPIVLFLIHLSYGIMFIKGFFIALFKKDNIYNE